MGSHSSRNIIRCSCNEKIVVQDREGLVLKSRIIKIIEGTPWVKCKRCGEWKSIPFMTLEVKDPDKKYTNEIFVPSNVNPKA